MKCTDSPSSVLRDVRQCNMRSFVLSSRMLLPGKPSSLRRCRSTQTSQLGPEKCTLPVLPYGRTTKGLVLTCSMVLRNAKNSTVTRCVVLRNARHCESLYGGTKCLVLPCCMVRRYLPTHRPVLTSGMALPGPTGAFSTTSERAWHPTPSPSDEDLRQFVLVGPYEPAYA